ncbi:DUF4224 domain-containing protein [Bordetella bronchialis]|uniref:DUF4224 domain-containing protein n=1 Tax=Bordetella bronchialis TaxID=463025 RepID=UPI0009F3C4D9
MTEDPFLTPQQTANFTGIRTGKRVAGKTIHREQLQAEWLRSQGIPFHINARGRPMILWSAIAGANKSVEAASKTWQPKVLRAA